MSPTRDPLAGAMSTPVQDDDTTTYTWDWSTELDTYLVRKGTDIVCRTSRSGQGYTRARAIADAMNEASERIGARA